MRLAVECCAPVPSAARVEAAAATVDWADFLGIVDRHRIAGLCQRALNGSAPDPFVAALAERARHDVAANLRGVAAVAEFEHRFDTAGIERLYVKGLTLSVLAFGDPFLKASADIDLLVAPDAIANVAAILGEMGFALVEPAGLPMARLGWWHHRNKESAWWRARDGLMLDLHTRLADSPAVLAGALDRPVQSVALSPSLSLPTLETPSLLAYLAVHGASSCWFRLKWIADFASLATRAGPAVLAEAVVIAESAGGENAMRQALLLGDSLFGGFLARDRRAALLESRLNRHLLSLAGAALAADEPTSRRLGTLRIHWNQLLMGPGAPAMALEAQRQLRAAWTNRRLRP